MNDSASVTASSLAIAEKRPRRTGGCVGIFFQLLDWNRRFAKKKLFSKRLLQPDRAKEASKKFGGDEKLPKLRLIADENSGGFPNKSKNGISSVNNTVGKHGVQTPSLVARLMGLESIPSVQRDKLLNDSSGEFNGGRRQKIVGDNDEFEKETTRQEFRPQKLQKTGMVDRRTVTRFGAEALQLKNVLSRSRKHHHPKLASPVKNTNHHTKRNSSRLIGAATRILEPGLQARNKSKYAITYTHSAGNPIKGENLDLFSQQASCKNCGNLVNIAVSTSKRDVYTSVLNPSFDLEQELQPQNYATPTYFKNNNKDFVALNRSLSGQTRSRVPAKVEDTKFDKKGKFVNCLSQGQKRQLTNNRPRMVNTAQSTAWKPDYQGQIGDKNSDGMAFRFNSQMKNRCEVPIKVERKRNQNVSSCKTISHKKCTLNQGNEKICLQKPFPLTGESLGVLLEEKLRELTSRVGYDSRLNDDQPKRTPANIFQELLCALSNERQITQSDMEFSPRRNHIPHHRNTSFCLQTKSEKAVGVIGRKNNNHLSPGSVLEASFSNDSCCSSSLEDSSVRTQHADSMSYSYDETQFQESETNPFYSGVLLSKANTHNNLVTDVLNYISHVLSTIDVVNSRIKGNIRAHVKEVIFNSELVLSNQMPHNHPNEINSFFICDLLLELDTLVEIFWTRFGNFLGSHNSNAGYQLKRLVFDALIAYLDSKYVQYSKCGFRAIPRFMGFDILIHEVVEEVRSWMGLVGVNSDELVERDMSNSLGKWMDFEIEVYETGAKIEWDILQMLVDEIVVDI